MSMLRRFPPLWMAAGIMATMLSSPVSAQDVDPEWPCIQRLILEISPATMWPIPVEEGMETAYRDYPDIRKLSEELGDIEVFTADHQEAIAAFADSVPEAEREASLTLLATGVVDVSNRIRGDYIRGIKRFTRQQIVISQQIEDSLNELSLLETNETASDGKARRETEETLRWHERVYDQRERSIQLLCEQPVELEQRLSDVLRYAAQYLP